MRITARRCHLEAEGSGGYWPLTNLNVHVHTEHHIPRILRILSTTTGGRSCSNLQLTEEAAEAEWRSNVHADMYTYIR